MFFAFGLIYLASSCWVAAQNANLTTVLCESSPCERGSFLISFKFYGTPPGSAAGSVGFYKNGGSFPFCSIDRLNPCSTSATSCYCTGTGDERTYHLQVDSANSSVHNGNWSAAMGASNPAEIVRSPVCQVKVNTGCQHLVTDNCPGSAETLKNFYVSFSRKIPFPSTQDAKLDFVVNGASEVTFNLTTDLLNTHPAGCFRRDNEMIYYYNTTALLRYSGSWMAVFKSASAGTIQSGVCQVTVAEPLALRVTEGIKNVLGILSGGLCCVVVFMIVFPLQQITKTVKCIVVFAGSAVVLIFDIALGAYSIGTQGSIIESYPFLKGGVIALLVIGSVVVLLGIIIGILIACGVKFPCQKSTQSAEMNGEAGTRPSARNMAMERQN